MLEVGRSTGSPVNIGGSNGYISEFGDNTLVRVNTKLGRVVEMIIGVPYKELLCHCLYSSDTFSAKFKDRLTKEELNFLQYGSIYNIRINTHPNYINSNNPYRLNNYR